MVYPTNHSADFISITKESKGVETVLHNLITDLIRTKS